MGIDYSLVICMAEDYRPTLETVEGIIRIFDKHGLKTARYPTEDRSKILLSKGTIEKGIARLREGSKISAPCPKCGLKEMVSSVDSQNTPRYSEFFIRCKKCNYEFKVEKKEDVALYIEERAALIKVIEKEGVVDSSLWLALHEIDWQSRSLDARLPVFLSPPFTRNDLHDLFLISDGPKDYRDALIRFHERYDDAPPRKTAQDPLLVDAQFTSDTGKSRTDALADDIAKALLGWIMPPATAPKVKFASLAPLHHYLTSIGTSKVPVPLERQQQLLKQWCAAELNRMLARIDESTIWAPTPQQKAIYLNIVAGMAGRALVPLFNPEWVGKELSAQGISQTRDIDVLYTMRNELGRINKAIAMNAKFYDISSITITNTPKGTMLGNIPKIAESIWDDCLATLFSLLTLDEYWIGFAGEGGANAQYITAIEDMMNYLNIHDSRFAGKLIRDTSQFLKWIWKGARFPLKLDVLKNSDLIDYINAEVAKHRAAGDIATYKETKMLEDIAAAHPELGAIMGHGKLFLVQNRDASGNELRDGIDPLNVNNRYFTERVRQSSGKYVDRVILVNGKPVVRPAWDAPYDPTLNPLSQWIARPDNQMSIQQFLDEVDKLPGKMAALEGYIVDMHDVTIRAVLTSKSRGEIVRQNMLLMDVVCRLANIPNSLRSATSGWWLKYLTGFPVVP